MNDKISLLLCIIIIIILYLEQISSYSFEVVNEQIQQVLVFQGNATNEEEVNEDLNQFCSQEAETCEDASVTSQILTHATRHVESNKILDNLGLLSLCKGTIVGPDAAIISEMAKELMTMESPDEIKKYVEIGSYLGCSTFIIANITSDSNVLIYAHDIWTESMEHLPTDSDPPPIVDDYFIKFYSEVIKRKFETSIIPIRGESNYTLNIHQNSSISLAFVDGDHSRLGCK